MNDNMNCVIKNDGTVHINYTQGGKSAYKVVSLDTFSGIITRDRESIELPLFPNNIRKYKKSGDNLFVVTEHPETVKDIIYHSSEFKMPVPRSVWLHHMRKNSDNDNYRMIRQHVYALKMPLFSEEQEVFQWPFPNYSTSYSPGVCWGSDRNFADLSRNVRIQNLSSMFDMYFSAAFNSDLSWKLGCDYEDLNNLDTFPLEHLIHDRDMGSITFKRALEYISS